MLRNITISFITGLVVTCLVLVAIFPILAIVADVMQAPSFDVRIGSIVLYSFVREGESVSTTLLPVGLLVFSLTGGLLNTGLRLLIGALGQASGGS